MYAYYSHTLPLTLTPNGLDKSGLSTSHTGIAWAYLVSAYLFSTYYQYGWIKKIVVKKVERNSKNSKVFYLPYSPQSKYNENKRGLKVNKDDVDLFSPSFCDIVLYFLASLSSSLIWKKMRWKGISSTSHRVIHKTCFK